VWFDPEGRYSTVRGHPMYYYSGEREFLDLIAGCGFGIVRQLKEPRLSDYPPYCAGNMWVLGRNRKLSADDMVGVTRTSRARHPEGYVASEKRFFLFFS